MKRTKGTICILLAVIMVLTMGIPAFAVDKATMLKNATSSNATAQTSTPENPFNIEISTDKSKYSVTGVAKITVKVTNTSNEAIENVSAEALFDGLTPVGKDSKIKAETEKLNNGDSLSFSYNAMIKSEYKGLNLFQKIILFFKKLFKKSVSVGDNGFDNGRECAEQNKTITFGKYDTKNTIRVWYAQNGSTTTSKDYEELIKGVDIDELYDYDESDISVDEKTGIEFLNNIVCITFEDDCPDSRKAEIINFISGEVVGGSETTNELYVKIKKSSYDELEDLCDRLNGEPGVYLTTKEEFTISTMSVNIPNDPWSPDSSETSEHRNWSDSFNVPNNNWNMIAINAPEAWLYQDYFSTINIGVVDSGFASSHPDLNINVISKTDTPDDHGTHVAGIIGATANNSKGITGVVWKKNIYAYDSLKSTDPNEKMSDKEIYNGIEELLKKGCKVINLSIGKSKRLSNSNQSLDEKEIKSEGKEASQKMIKFLKKYGDFVIVQAAGNGASDEKGVDAINNGNFCSITKDNCYADKTFSYEYIKDRIIVVGNAMIDSESTPRKYICATSSNGGNQVNIIAPGTNILSTVLPYEVGEGTWYCRSMGGTSMAAPIVTGVASLVWSVNPSFTGKQVRDIVLNTAKEGGILVKDNPNSPTTGDFYMVNAKLAVEEAIRQTYTTCMVKGSIVDQNGNAVDDVKIRTVDSKTHTVRDFYSGSDGKYEFLLPIGKYEFTFTKSGYGEMRIVPEEAFTANQTANLGELVMFAEKSNVSGTVKDKYTNAPIAGVSVEVIDNAAGTFDPIYTVETDENGRFSLALPVGSYSISFNHDDYEYYSRSLSVENSGIPMELADVLLTPTGSAGDDGDIIDSGSCGKTVNWTLYSSGTLIISGQGEMTNYQRYYPYSYAPWYSKKDSIKKVIVNNGVTHLGYNSFYLCSNISKITLPSSLIDISSGVFYGCSSIKKIVIPNSVKTIGGYAFSECSSLMEIAMPNTIIDIETGAFYNCTSLTDIDIPNGVSSIGDSIFSGCSNLKRITIPESVTNIGRSAFYNCISLTDINIPNGVSCIKDGTFENCSDLKRVTIPNTVTSIGNWAFESCVSLTDINIPSCITYLGSYVFSGCVNLESFTIPNGVEDLTCTFRNCRNLRSITIGSGITSIVSAFEGCTSLTNVFYNNDIEHWCLIEYTGDFSHPNYYAENICLKGSPVTEINIPNLVTNIDNYLFCNFKESTSLTIPNSVTSIGASAFKNCQNLKNVVIPDSVVSVGTNAFDNCPLVNVVIGDGLTSIPTTLLKKGTLETFVIGNGVTEINKEAFFYSQQLTDVVIGNGVKTIGKEAFSYCSNLQNITIGSGVETIGSYCFSACDSLENLYYNGDMESWCNIIFLNYNSDAPYFSDYGHPNYYAENIYFNGELVTNINIPDTITSIKPYTFLNFTDAISVTIPSSVTSIGMGAFSNCIGLSNLYYGGDIEKWCNINFDGYTSHPNYYADYIYFNGNLVTEINIPITISEIGNYTFAGFKDVESITIPNQVTSCENWAFCNCQFKNVIMGDGLTYIPQSLINEETLETFIIGNGITNISNSAFIGCTKIERIVIPNNVVSIGQNAFEGCWNLTEVTLPNNLTSIENSVFKNCFNLKSISIPCCVESIGSSAFESCYNLETITIPNSVLSIGYSSFYRCNNLKDVFYTGAENQWKQISIGYYNEPLKNATIHYNGN